MAIATSLSGRLRNTSLPKSHPLLPLFEAVVNAIQAVDENHRDDMDSAHIEIKVIRDAQDALNFSDDDQYSAIKEPISAFIVTDNGEGFHDENMTSFETLDSEYKSEYGCRGVGRLLWLKAFKKVEVVSHYLDAEKIMKRREFIFTKDEEVSGHLEKDSAALETGSEVRLLQFQGTWKHRAPKGIHPIARGILEHCLWYFVRPGGAPRISISDDVERLNLHAIFSENILTEAVTEHLKVKGHAFDIVHLRLKATGGKANPQLYWCAGSRVVREENLIGRVPGLYGKLKDDKGDFIYACYITSSFLDNSVRPERIEFDIPETDEGSFDEDDPSMSDIRADVLKATERYLHPSLTEVRAAGRERVRRFVDTKSHRYRPVLRHMDEAKLDVDPTIGDNDLELLLHKNFTEFEVELLAEGQRVLDAEGTADEEYKERLKEYLTKIDDAKKSDLAAYVSRRRTNLDLLAKAINANEQGSYATEDVIHNLIIPMRKTSDDVSDSVSNLWIIDERLAFHNYLASDLPIKVMPISGSNSALEPDIAALKVSYGPILASERESLPLTSIVVVEIKRPMRNDVRPGHDKDPLRQALRYLTRIRGGNVKTASGRLIERSDHIPGFCYIIADLTPSMVASCEELDLKPTGDGGYFGYHSTYKAYIEVSSFDRLLEMAHQRNRAFFDRLGPPTA